MNKVQKKARKKEKKAWDKFVIIIIFLGYMIHVVLMYRLLTNKLQHHGKKGCRSEINISRSK